MQVTNMGKKQSVGGWLKKIPGLGKKKSESKPTAADESESQKEKSASPARKLHRNPLMPGHQAADAPQPDPVGSGENTQPVLSDSILVIDDSEIDRMIIEELLTDAGYNVILAVDGEDGVKKCLEHRPALVVTDMIMPGMNGTEVILKIRAESPGTQIIAMSAGGELGPRAALTVPSALKLYTISKPVDPEELLAAVKTYFK
jgi:CheY-like chemotaxis protein